MPTYGFKSAQRELEKLGDDLDDAVNDAASNSMDATERRAKRTLVENDTVARVGPTNVFNSFVQTVVERPDAGRRYKITNEAPHAKFVEWGTGARFGTSFYTDMPPNRYAAPQFGNALIEAIDEWIISKPSFIPEGPPRTMAGAIAKRIAGLVEGKPSGQDPQPFMRKAWFYEKPKFKADLKLRVMRATRRF